mgnify:CR=1 FL=1
MAVLQLDTQGIIADSDGEAVDLSGIAPGFLYYQLAIANNGAAAVYLCNPTETPGPTGLLIPNGAAIYSPIYTVAAGAPVLYAAGTETCAVSVLVVVA